MPARPLWIATCCLAAGWSANFQASHATAQGLQQKILGKWIVNLRKSEKLDEDAAQVVSQLRSLGIEMGVEFKTDDAFTVSFTIGGNTTTQNGTWQVTKETTRKLLVEMTLAGSQAAKKTSILRIDDNHVRMDTDTRDPGKRHSLVLKRVD